MRVEISPNLYVTSTYENKNNDRMLIKLTRLGFHSGKKFDYSSSTLSFPTYRTKTHAISDSTFQFGAPCIFTFRNIVLCAQRDTIEVTEDILKLAISSFYWFL